MCVFENHYSLRHTNQICGRAGVGKSQLVLQILLQVRAERAEGAALALFFLCMVPVKRLFLSQGATHDNT